MNNNKCILICDDDDADVILLRKLLKSDKMTNYEILESYSAEDLFTTLRAKKQKVDLVFLDYYLGTSNGLDLLPEIRKNNVPVIMLTGRGDEEIAVECMKEGASDYLPKDTLGSHDLNKVIDQAIERWEVEQERDQLLGITAHELRNPIAVILGYTDMLIDGYDISDDERKEIFHTIHERSNHLLSIINGLLDITRIDKGIIVLRKKQCDLKEIVAKISTQYRMIASQKNISIEVHCKEENLRIECDQDRIEEAITNLLDNAVKYSHGNTAVSIFLSRTDKEAQVSVRDQGPGINENELKYLFKLFSSKKISTLPTGQESKTGLGLAISKKVIDAHNGQILVESEVGKGSTFIIQLPLSGN